VAAVNKMDLVGYSQESFTAIRQEFEALCAQLGLADEVTIPVSALEGDNVVTASATCRGTRGQLCWSIWRLCRWRWLRRPGRCAFQCSLCCGRTQNFRGFAGQVARGTLRAGDRVMALPSRRETTVKRIVTYDGDLAAASYPQSVTVELEDEID